MKYMGRRNLMGKKEKNIKTSFGIGVTGATPPAFLAPVIFDIRPTF
jgi:hypothetical protein